MRVILLSGGQYVAVVSREDFRKVNKYKWYAHKSKGRGRKAGQIYARATVSGKKVYLHRFIMNPEQDSEVDHVNGQPLDCRRENLEIVTKAENLRRKNTRRSGL